MARTWSYCIPPHVIAGGGARVSLPGRKGPFWLRKHGRGSSEVVVVASWREGLRSSSAVSISACESLSLFLVLLLLLFVFSSHCFFQYIVLISTHDLHFFKPAKPIQPTCWMGQGTWWIMTDDIELLTAFFISVFISETGLQEPQVPETTEKIWIKTYPQWRRTKQRRTKTNQTYLSPLGPEKLNTHKSWGSWLIPCKTTLNNL